MNSKSALMCIIVFGFATFLSLLVSPVESKSPGHGNRPVGNQQFQELTYRPPLDVSRKTFGSEKVVAFAAGAYVGGKVVSEVN